MLRNEVTKVNMTSEHFLTSTPLLKIVTYNDKQGFVRSTYFLRASSSGWEVCIVTVNTKSNRMGTSLWSTMETKVVLYSTKDQN